jgi:hypothetical protein
VPYEGEFAGYRSLTRLAAHPRVRSMLENCEPWSPPPAGVNPMPIANVRPSGWLPDWILAVDGSFHQTQVENGYPGAEVCYLVSVPKPSFCAATRQLKPSREVDYGASIGAAGRSDPCRRRNGVAIGVYGDAPATPGQRNSRRCDHKPFRLLRRLRRR